MTVAARPEESRPADLPEPAPATRTARGRSRYGKAAVFVAALLFFTGPALAGAAGQRATTIENRALTPFPSLSDGWAFFPKLSAWATDQLPLRDHAVAANERINERVFHELPATAGNRSPVILGKDGWLFLTEDITNACTFQARIPQLPANVARLARLTRAGGSFTLVVPPDKTSIETDHLPGTYPSQSCAAAGKQALHRSLHDAPPPGYVDLFGPIEEVKRAHGTAYKPQDTHFADYGNVQYAKVLADHLDPALWPGTEVVATGPQSAPGDLNALRGRPGPTTFDGASIRRQGVTTQITDQTVAGVGARVGVSSTTASRLVPGRTVLVGDSFSEEALSWLAPFFQELVYVRITSGQVTAPDLARLLSSADRVVVELVERYYVSPDVAVLNSGFLDQMEKTLATK